FLELAPHIDYVSNTDAERPTYPVGMSVEVFNRPSLDRAHREARKNYQREHVTPYLLENSGLFRLQRVSSPINLSHHRWTVDHPEDFELVKRVIEALDRPAKVFHMEDVLAFLEDHPEVVALNRHIRPNEGFVKSVREEPAL